VTGQASYFETAERIWRNGLYANQANNGGFCHHHVGHYGFTGEGNEAWWCCAYHGPRAYYTILRHLTSWNDEGVQIQFFEPLDVELPLPQGKVRLIQTTDYPRTGQTTITVIDTPPGGVPLQIRVPSWARIRSVQRNGVESSRTVLPSGYLPLSDAAQPGDTFALEFPYSVRLGPEHEERQSFWFGPLLLAVEIPGGATHAVVVPPPDAEGNVPLPSAKTIGDPLAIPEAHFKIAGLGSVYRKPFESLALNRPQLGRLRPLSEQTTYRSQPPAIVSVSVIEARTPLLKEELQTVLRGNA
jgi:uncharacterized protein